MAADLTQSPSLASSLASYSELQHEYDLLTEEIQFLQQSDRTDDLSPRARFRLKKQIEAAQQERAEISEQLQQKEKEKVSAKNYDDKSADGKNCGEDLHRTLLRLGYRRQIRLFRRMMETALTGGAFLIHGYPDYGQGWLLNRLVVQYVPYFLTGKVIKVYVSRKVRRNDVSALWREVAGRVGLRGKPYNPTEIAAQVCQCLETQNVLLVFHEVEKLPEAVLCDLIESFWLPLVSQVGACESSKYKLLMFLLDYEGAVDSWQVPFSEQLEKDWSPRVPIKSPMIDEFSDDDLTDWIESEYDRLPDALTSNIDDAVQSILTQSENGVPELVLDVICERCGCDWYEESKKWLSL
ncbi:MAG: hypothetical protein AAFQ63_09915 [Cyanobacteria bacterium J06621_11]